MVSKRKNPTQHFDLVLFKKVMFKNKSKFVKQQILKRIATRHETKLRKSKKIFVKADKSYNFY